MKVWLSVLFAILLVIPSYGIRNFDLEESVSNDFIGHFEKIAYIRAGEDFYIHFNPSDGIEFEEEKFNLSHKEKIALAKSPEWIRWRLAKQFENLSDEYASLLINSSNKYTDEIAFCIATCPINGMPSPQLLYDNAYFIYKNDEYLDYVSIVDFENGSSTIRYTTLDGKELNITCPMGIYYWYVVHPRITFEDAEYVYNKFWREYLLYHNDIGYPLLLEKLHGIKYLWDNQTYYPPKHRTWKWSMENHPTAIEAINYWIGKTVNQLATGDRPGQPNIIAHEHNGFCGELQQIAVAAQRAALIPSVGINDLGEDHVWREFWERGWHECDNWWADGGGCVANYSEYRYRWGKIISALFAWNGDSSIYDVTPKYIKAKDRVKLTVEVRDLFGKPVDGACVMIFGSWKANNFKDRLWSKYVDKLWQKMPEQIRQKWQEKYDELKKFYHERIPGFIPWILPSIWNYTNVDGKCNFNLGLGHSYTIVVYKDEFFYIGPYSIGKSNAIRYKPIILTNRTKEMKIKFVLPDFKQRLNENVLSSPSNGKYSFSINFKCYGYQKQRNPWDWKFAMHPTDGKINFFIVDGKNFERYKKGEKFDCYEYRHAANGDIKFYADDEIYIVFSNTAKRTDVKLSVVLDAYGKGDFIHIISPCNMANAGVITIKGYATNQAEVEIEGDKWNVNDYFEIKWNTSIGNHTIIAKCGSFVKQYEIEVVDFSPPSINIFSPEQGKIFDEEVKIEGSIKDNAGIRSVVAYINGNEFELQQNFNFSLNLMPGDYELKIIAEDIAGLKSMEKINFVVAGNKSKPLIKDIYYEPDAPTNESNVIIYAFIEPTFYKIKDAYVIMDGKEIKMYRYADYPPQPRHEEDALKNLSNEPRYGIELGQLEKGIYKFKIKVVDTAGNEAISNEYEIKIE